MERKLNNFSTLSIHVTIFRELCPCTSRLLCAMLLRFLHFTAYVQPKCTCLDEIPSAITSTNFRADLCHSVSLPAFLNMRTTLATLQSFSNSPVTNFFSAFDKAFEYERWHIMLQSYKILVKPHLECCVQF